jgi:hypothetical protein
LAVEVYVELRLGERARRIVGRPRVVRRLREVAAELELEIPMDDHTIQLALLILESQGIPLL